MRLKRILEAVAERICCPEAHRSVWRNWILEGAHRTFGSQTLDRAASQPISKAGRPAIHPRQNPLPVEKDLDRCRLPCSDSAIPSVGRIQASYAVIHMQGRMTNPDSQCPADTFLDIGNAKIRIDGQIKVGCRAPHSAGIVVIIVRAVSVLPVDFVRGIFF